jgi:predicted ArsR family transcriptional regulator
VTDAKSSWRFFTNHFHVLLHVARYPDARLSSVADAVGITERAAHRILTELAREGYVTVTKHGRRNHYRVNDDSTLRHPYTLEVPLSPLVKLVSDSIDGSHVGLEKDGLGLGPGDAALHAHDK